MLDIEQKPGSGVSDSQTGWVEFYPVIFALDDHVDPLSVPKGVPKPLFPLANHALIKYILEMLDMAGFRRATIFVCDNWEDAVRQAVQECYSGSLVLRIEAVPRGAQDAEILRDYSHQFSSDILVFPCDIVSDFQIYHLADVHRINDALISVLLHDVTKSNKGSLKAEGENRFYVGTDTKTQRILLYREAAGQAKPKIDISKSLLSRVGNITLNSNIVDTGVYALSQQVFAVLEHNTSIASIASDLLPMLVDKQYAPDRTEILDSRQNSSACFSGDEEDPIRIYACLTGLSYFSRPHSLKSVRDMNRDILTGAVNVPCEKTVPSDVKKNQLSNDSSVGARFAIGERSSVKRSSVGANCKIGSRSKVNNSIIFGDVVIGNSCSVTGSVIYGHNVLEDACNIKDCIVGPGYVVQKDTTIAGQTLVANQAIKDS